jgi:hypothetical protein
MPQELSRLPGYGGMLTLRCAATDNKSYPTSRAPWVVRLRFVVVVVVVVVVYLFVCLFDCLFDCLFVCFLFCVKLLFSVQFGDQNASVDQHTRARSPRRASDAT